MLPGFGIPDLADGQRKNCCVKTIVNPNTRCLFSLDDSQMLTVTLGTSHMLVRRIRVSLCLFLLLSFVVRRGLPPALAQS